MTPEYRAAVGWLSHSPLRAAVCFTCKQRGLGVSQHAHCQFINASRRARPLISPRLHTGNATADRKRAWPVLELPARGNSEPGRRLIWSMFSDVTGRGWRAGPRSGRAVFCMLHNVPCRRTVTRLRAKARPAGVTELSSARRPDSAAAQHVPPTAPPEIRSPPRRLPWPAERSTELTAIGSVLHG